MKTLIPILIGLLVTGCEEEELIPQQRESHQQQASSTEVNKPSFPSISIHEAAEKGDLEAIKQHIAAGTNINSTNGKDGETPLHRAITRGQTEAVKLLIEKGCDINIGRSKDGDTPLDMAESRGRTKSAKLLRDKGAKRNNKERPTQSAKLVPQQMVDAFLSISL